MMIYQIEMTVLSHLKAKLLETMDDATVVKFTEVSNAKSNAKPKEDEGTKSQVDIKLIVLKKKNRKRLIEMVQDTMKGIIK